ncbi:Hypothetical protein SMAX5B_000497 [Scophthalmus maximus]|uniref:Uncharacterized protein n=1 Tax=Scophthalmus maximus TaxID=52904 RepID=A0A2U9CK94_SCOMX|nr:Hypothetical protein SMAX5B_000497 [Scophthalmus maximus]
MAQYFPQPTAHSPLRVRNGHGEMGRWGDGEAVLGEIQGQNTHVSSISHLPPQAQHITSLLDIITPSEEPGLAEQVEWQEDISMASSSPLPPKHR